jgi:hydrogenase nickel incorporation protein HypA/HybF
LHEWALAEAVISAASEVADKENLKEVTEVIVKVGELQGVELEILDFAFSQLKAGKFKNAEFKMETVRAKLQCRVCGQSWVLDREKLDENTAEAIHFVPEVAHAYIKCPECGSPDFEILEGRGVWLQTIRGER